MHYIAIFIIYCNDAIVNAIKIAYETVGDGANAEETINAIFKKALLGAGLVADAAMIIYIGIVFQTIFYLIAYINRMLKVAFLIVISPLITVTYSIDKMGDGKAQALDTWLKEYIYTILIQPFHCIIYFSFISIAFSLINEGGFFDTSFNQLSAGILAILCIKFINDGEKIVRKIFGFQDDNSKTSMMAGAMMAVAAAKSTTNMISKAKVGVNKTTAFAGKLKKDFIKDAPAMKNILSRGKENGGIPGKLLAKVGDGIELAGKGVDKLDKGIKNVGNRIGNTKPMKAITGVRNKMGNFRRNTKAGRIADFAARKTLSTSAAIMAFAATYATGDTDALSAIGYGAAASKGMDKAFDTSAGRNDADAAQSYAEASEAQRESLEQNAKILEDNIDKHEELMDSFDEVEEKCKELDELKKQPDDDPDEIKKADDADKAAEAAEEKARQEELAAAKALEKKKLGNLSSSEISRLQKEAEDHQKEAAEQKRIAEEKRNIAQKIRSQSKQVKMQELQDQIAELDPEGTIQKYLNSKSDYEGQTKKEKFAADIFKEKQELAAMQRELKEFYTEASSKARIDAMKNSVTDKEIKSKANEIERLIQEIVAARHLLAVKDGLSVENEIVSLDDTETGTMIANNLTNALNRDFITHSNASSMDLIRQSGLRILDTDEGRGDVEKQTSPYIEGLMKQLNLAVSQQKYNYRVRGISQAEEINKAMGRSQSAFDARSKSLAMTEIQENGRRYQKQKEKEAQG